MTTTEPAFFQGVIRGKRDYRAYEERPLPDAALRRILLAGRQAGSAKHAQPCRFIVVRDPARRREVAACGDFTAPLLAAPLAVAIVTVPPEGQWDPERAQSFDAGRAAQNMMLTAWAEGIASCPTTMHRHDDAARVLALPPGHRVTWVIAFGFPAADSNRTPRPRLPLEQYVHEDRWGGAFNG